MPCNQIIKQCASITLFPNESPTVLVINVTFTTFFPNELFTTFLINVPHTTFLTNVLLPKPLTNMFQTTIFTDVLFITLYHYAPRYHYTHHLMCPTSMPLTTLPTNFDSNYILHQHNPHTFLTNIPHITFLTKGLHTTFLTSVSLTTLLTNMRVRARKV